MVTIDHSFSYKHGATVNHPLILIQGQLRNQIQSGIEVTNQTSGETINWPVVSSKFKALILLKPGINMIILRHGFYSKEVNYTFILRQSPYIVQCGDNGIKMKTNLVLGVVPHCTLRRQYC